MRINQTDSGKAFEMALARSFSHFTKSKIKSGSSLDIAERAFMRHTKKMQDYLLRVADEAAAFLLRYDKRIELVSLITLQEDTRGKMGDVRDLLLRLPNDENIGISAKNKHTALKHSRLSSNIDFGQQWFGLPCSNIYFHTIRPIFEELQENKENGLMWRDINDKHERYYIPILHAFIAELQRLYNLYKEKVAGGLMAYLLGKQDYYKIMKNNGTLTIQSFNLHGSLRWGDKCKFPTRIERIAMKEKSMTTLHVSLSGGWSVSMRLHNAESRVIPSLKFDVQLLGMPVKIASNIIPLDKIPCV